MRLDKIYTRVGDKGTSLLATGQRVSKASLRLEAYGMVDELNSHIGVLRDLWAPHDEKFREANLSARLLRIQHELFDTGAELASVTREGPGSSAYLAAEQASTTLEKEMDQFNSTLSPLSNFVLPGGHPVNSQAHVARCICRRAERAVIRLHEEEEIRGSLRIYLNRLSDWLFILGRYTSGLLGVDEVLWQQKPSS